jgi:hypothetical protein
MKTFPHWRNVGRAMLDARRQEGVTVERVRVPGARYHVWARGDTKVTVDHTEHSAGFAFEDPNSQFEQFHADAAEALRVLAALELIPADIAYAADERYGRCERCGLLAQWWPAEAEAGERWVHVTRLRFDLNPHPAEVTDA